jgi:hypothetical protein
MIGKHRWVVSKQVHSPSTPQTGRP